MFAQKYTLDRIYFMLAIITMFVIFVFITETRSLSCKMKVVRGSIVIVIVLPMSTKMDVFVGARGSNPELRQYASMMPCPTILALNLVSRDIACIEWNRQ